MPRRLLTVRIVACCCLAAGAVGLPACGGGNGDGQPPVPVQPPSDAPGQNVNPDQPSTGGQPTGQPRAFNGKVVAVVYAEERNGSIYVAGEFTTYGGRTVPPVVRIQPSGELDSTFTLQGSLGRVTGVAAADDGSGDLYVGESVFDASTSRSVLRVWRVNSNGTVDRSFAVAEMDQGVSSGEPLALWQIAPVGDGSGRIYVAGAFARFNGEPQNGLVRVQPNGARDLSFNSVSGYASRVLPERDGSLDVYVVNYGRVSPSVHTAYLLYRLNADGSRDDAFRPVNFFPFGIIQLSPRPDIRALAFVGDGSGDLYVGGTFILDPSGDVNPLFDPTAIRGLARINRDGSVDRAQPRPVVEDERHPTAIAKAVDGTEDWFVAGTQQLTRHDAEGGLDAEFAVGTFNGTASIILPVPDGTADVYVAGDLTSYAGSSVGRIVRLNGNGTLD